MRHVLHALGRQRPLDSRRQVLQHHPARHLAGGVPLAELRTLVPDPAADVDVERPLGVVETLRLLSHGVHAQPGEIGLPPEGHVGVEVVQLGRVGHHPLEGVHGGLPALVEGRVGFVGGVLVVDRLEVRRHRPVLARDDAVVVPHCGGHDMVGEVVGDVVGGEGGGGEFGDDVDGVVVAEEAACG